MNLSSHPANEGVSRRAARVLVIGASGRILLLRAREPRTGHAFWVAPGGGVDEGESVEAAAVRELLEETGIACAMGRCVWTRRHLLVWNGVHHDQSEWFFVTAERLPEEEILPPAPDTYVEGYRWWSLEEIAASDDDFAPRRLAELLAPILDGNFPSEPFDCGV